MTQETKPPSLNPEDGYSSEFCDFIDHCLKVNVRYIDIDIDIDIDRYRYRCRCRCSCVDIDIDIDICIDIDIVV